MLLTRSSVFSPLSAESLSSLFSEKDETGDLVFRTSDGKAVLAHSVLIAAAMNPAWRGALDSHHYEDDGPMVVMLPDATASELEAALCFVYGTVDTYLVDGGNVLAELLNLKKMPHRPPLKRYFAQRVICLI